MTRDIYPWTLAGGVLALLVGFVLIANGLAAGGVLVGLLGLGLALGGLIARGSHVRRQRHEELLAAMEAQRDS